MRKLAIALGSLFVAALLAAPAAAQVTQEEEIEYDVDEGQIEYEREVEYDQEADVTPTTTQPPPPPIAEPAEPEPMPLFSTVGLRFSLGGGISEFTDSPMEDMTDLGGNWEARLLVGANSILGLEAAYIGSARDIDALGLDDDAVLLGTGVEANARLNFLKFADDRADVYAVGGIGWNHYEIVNEGFNTSNVQDHDGVLIVPVGVGLGYRVERLTFDVRGTWRPAFDEELIRLDVAPDEDDGSSLDSWSALGRVGFEF